MNETKTRLCRLPAETFDFLGDTLGRHFDPRTGESYLGSRPSRKKVIGLCRELSEMTGRNPTCLEVFERICRINHKLRGWSNDFRIRTRHRAYKSISEHVRRRVRQWLGAKFRVCGRGKTRFTNAHLYDELQLYRLL